MKNSRKLDSSQRSTIEKGGDKGGENLKKWTIANTIHVMMAAKWLID